MGKGRLEAFSDGVIAIIITIMVLELKVPHGAEFAALKELGPVFLSYILSFVFVGIYWNNHHHTFHAVKHVSAGILWSNLNLLFWLSLLPFTTGWMGENHFASLPVATYGVNLLLCAFAYTILIRAIIVTQGKESAFAKAVGSDRKGFISLACYVLAIPLAFYYPLASGALFALVSLIWLIPDRRMEKAL
jgi:uncharacterized membrane protein